MTVELTRESGRSLVGELWVFRVSVHDLDGDETDTGVPVATVTLPAATTSTPTLEHEDTGCYRFTYTPAVAGRFLVSVTSTHGLDALAVYAEVQATALAFPTIVDWQDYAAGDFSYTDDEISEALAAEIAAQRRIIRPRATFEADVREALLRRVSRNLAMRRFPLAAPAGDADAGPVFLPRIDPEIARLERPHRRMTVG